MTASCCQTTETLGESIAAALREKKPVMLASLAERFGVSELEVARALPDEARAFAGKDAFDTVWQALASWENATFIMAHLGSVIEIKGKIPEGRHGHGYFNLSGGSGLGGHLKIDDLVFTLYGIGKPFRAVFQRGGHGPVLRVRGPRKPSTHPGSARVVLRAARGRGHKGTVMKALVVYSSRTGNTRKIAEAIAAVLPGCEIHPVESAPAPEGYDLVAVGYWVDKGMPDAQAKAYLETVRDAKVALFGTLGAWPDSDHARDCIAQGEALVNAPERRNKVLGTYLCQGKVDPKIVAMMQKMASDVHPMTPERKARLEEAAKHPDEADCLRAQEAFKGFAEQVA